VLTLPIEQAKPGMTLAAPVTHPDHPDQDLLKAGYALEPQVIQRLKGMGVGYIYVDYPGLDDLDRHLAVNLSPARQRLYTQIKETIVAGQQRTRPAVSYADYYNTTRELVLTLMSQGQHPVYIEHMSRLGDDAITHSTAVAHLGLLLGIKLQAYLVSQRRRLSPQHAKEVVNIGVAGMLHDMGKLRLPPELQQYNGAHVPKKPDDLLSWQGHVQEGYEMIRSGVEPSAAAAVLHHHQHWDGSGFPAIEHRDGTKSLPSQERIHIFARIVSVADLYDRLATPAELRPARRPNLQVLHLLRTQYASWCDPTVLKALHLITPPFPPGSILMLSDGSNAVVVDIGYHDPYRPLVKRVIGPDLQLDEKRTDLSEPDAPRITHLGKTPVEGLVPETDLNLVPD
jgi:HD-GYP domain-containing protein (c-di-GMP phosphodiesterase class II)